MHQVNLSDKAYEAYAVLAERMGLTVEEYLDQSAPEDDGFQMTPEIRKAIEIGLEQADRGEVYSLSQVRESLEKYKAEWKKDQI